MHVKPHQRHPETHGRDWTRGSVYWRSESAINSQLLSGREAAFQQQPATFDSNVKCVSRKIKQDRNCHRETTSNPNEGQRQVDGVDKMSCSHALPQTMFESVPLGWAFEFMHRIVLSRGALLA
jgi:hypothetical protein